MKKTYSVPQIAFQTLNATTFSGGCHYDTLPGANHGQYQCPVKDPDFDVTIFVTGSCDAHPEDLPGGDKICYTNAGENHNVYNS